MISRSISSLALLGFLLVGCTTLQTPEPKTAVYKQSVREIQDQLLTNIENQSRLRGIIYPILKSNADLCKSRVTRLEFEWLTLNDLRLIGDIQRDAGAAIGISTFPTVTVITPGSPAFQAGLRTGDMLVSINEIPVLEDKEEGFVRWYARFGEGDRIYREVLNSKLRRATWSDDVTLEYKRGEETHQIEFQPIERCDLSIATVTFDGLSSKTAEDAVVVSTALLDFAENDSEVQFLVAHELAHINYGHSPGRLTPLGAVATTADLFINIAFGVASGIGNTNPTSPRAAFLPGAIFSRQNNPPYRSVLELEADYLAMYMLARSNIDISGYADFWERIPPESQLAKVHVMEEGRIENMKAVQEEIKHRIATNAPLIPAKNKKVRSKAAVP